MEVDDDALLQKVGHLLSTSHELSQNILKRLCYRDLVSASEVCQTWSRIGNFMLEKKRRLRYAVIHPSGFPSTDFRNRPNVSLPPHEALDQFFEKMPKDFCCCLGFANGGWLFRKDIQTMHAATGATLAASMTKAFPNDCQIALICSSGVIGTTEAMLVTGNGDCETLTKAEEGFKIGKTDDSCSLRTASYSGKSCASSRKVGYSIEIEEPRTGVATDDVDALSLVLFPRQPGFKMNIIYLDEDQFYKQYRPKTVPATNLVLGGDEFNSLCNLEPDEDLKALLMFYCDNNILTKAFISAAVSRQKETLALGGGMVRTVQQKGDLQTGTIAVAFSGSNVTASSLIVPSSVRTSGALEHYLNKLKLKYIPEAQNICFLFACCGRGQLWYRRSKPGGTSMYANVETFTFRRLFPGVPIVGFFGEGEVGLNYLPGDTGEELLENKRKKRIFHQYTSIFVLVSIL